MKMGGTNLMHLVILDDASSNGGFILCVVFDDHHMGVMFVLM